MNVLPHTLKNFSIFLALEYGSKVNKNQFYFFIILICLGFDAFKYKGGLDTKGNTTGLYSIYTEHHSAQVFYLNFYYLNLI